MSFVANAVSKTVKVAARPSFGRSISRRSFASAEFKFKSAEFTPISPAARSSPFGGSPRGGYQMNNRQREQLSMSLSRAMAPKVGEYSPLADAVNRIKGLRFNSTATNRSPRSPRSRLRAANDKHAQRMASREAFRAKIVDSCSLSPP